jgi:hypothetical protein
MQDSRAPYENVEEDVEGYGGYKPGYPPSGGGHKPSYALVGVVTKQRYPLDLLVAKS